MAYVHVPVTTHPLPVVQAPQGAPHCWGVQYNSEDRECRSCGVQASCRSEVLRKDMAARAVGQPQMPPPPPQMYYNNQPQYQPPQYQYQQPRPGFGPPPPPAPAQQVPVRYAQPPVQQQPLQPRPLPQPPVNYGYGAVHDPMLWAFSQVPDPFRPQVTGEAFAERIAKNMILAGIEAVMREAMLGVRALFWFPRQEALPQQIDVTPRQ